MRWLATVLAALGLLAAIAVVVLNRPERPLTPRASLSVAGALRNTDDQGYAKALASRTFHFPDDHGPHPEFRTEWWYYTGNLATEEGRRFGFQLTFFRSALAPQMPVRRSSWATRQAWLAHFTVTDVEDGTFHSFERWSRGALDLAGAQAQPFRVWVKNWTAAAVGEQASQIRLNAADDGVGADLVLQPGKPPVLQGERGLSRKSAEPGNASYYYSLTRLPAAGIVRVGGERFSVTGLAWMDREWSTSSLGKDQVGWDWFSLQLANGWDLMLYRLRRKDGTADPASSGALIAPDGVSRTLGPAEFQIDSSGEWRSPRSGARYPARWRLRVPAEDLDLRVRPLLEDQELDVSFRYWEGAVAVVGTHRGRPVRGNGYVELTGYAEGSRR
ncbi:MAG TPA: lipocalin-like domain-containing protein [Thermoanaerobaculia bacterium]|jgi:predicted secreted hydrolase|nr:lipocalin-like domain-containing protein [Thermoanaerobaculia bacterium]